MRHIEPPFQVSLSLADNWEIISDQENTSFPMNFRLKHKMPFILKP